MCLIMNTNKELCICCCKPTLFNINTPITLRYYFEEELGRLCEKRFCDLYLVAEDLIVPFGAGLDQQLGSC